MESEIVKRPYLRFTVRPLAPGRRREPPTNAHPREDCKLSLSHALRGFGVENPDGLTEERRRDMIVTLRRAEIETRCPEALGEPIK